MSGLAEPLFAQSATAPDLYWLNDGTRRAGFRPSGSVAFGASVSLTQSWGDARGLWFWLDAAPGADSDFAASLNRYLALLPPVTGPRTLWVSGAQGDIASWRSNQIGMTRTAGITRVSSGGMFETGGIRVLVGEGNQVSVGEYANDWNGWGFSLSGTPGLLFVTGDGLLSATSGLSGFSYAPGQTGCLRWSLSLAPGTGSTPSDLTRLGASLRFFGPDPSDDGSIRVLSVEPLRQTTALTLYCSFDPLAPLDPARTRLALLPWGAALGSVPSFDSGYVSARGYGVQLAPRNLAVATPPGFVFAVQPLVTGALDGPPSDVPVVYYLTPDGDFDLTFESASGQWLTAAPLLDNLEAAPLERLLCGANGLDYVGLASSAGTLLSFRAGQPAYAPPNIDSQTQQLRRALDEQPAPAALTALGTTAWSWVSAGSSVRYYAQPEDAPFYTGGNAGFLDYLEIAAATLTSTQALPAFPMLGYAGLDPAQAAFAQDLEARGIAPERRRQIKQLTHSQWFMSEDATSRPTSAPATVQPAVSPPGLAIGYAGDDVPWAWLAIGNTGSAADGLPDLRFSAVDGAFRQALLTNRLFMVLGDSASVLANGSVAYQLTAESLGLIKALPPLKGVPAEVYNAVAAAVRAANYPVYPTESAFNAMLVAAVSTITDEQKLVFQRFAGLLSPQIGDWLFRLSPRNWSAPERSGPKHARLIFKFVRGRTLEELVADTSGWTWAEASSVDGQAETARADIQSIIRNAREAASAAAAKGMPSAYEHFLEVIEDPYWTGVLALSVEVPLDTLPEPLQPLAAGIDPQGFYAHHLGLNSTSFSADKGALAFDVTSSFGLIDYQNPVDQYFSSDIPFAFRVQQLTVGFENGKLASFTSSVQLMVNRLFGSETRLFPTGHGNNLILDGVYQSERNDGGGNRDTYVFALREVGAFQLPLGQLNEVAVDTTRLVTVRAAEPASGNTTVTAAFQLSGRLRFAEPAEFDPFCWGPPTSVSDALQPLTGAVDPPIDTTGSAGLVYSNYAITMSFSLSQPDKVTFTVAEAGLALDAVNSPARSDSLFARFPLRLTGLLATADPKVTGTAPSTLDPNAAGYVSVSAPLQQGKLTQPWYGLVYEVDLGTLGALAGSVGLTVQLLAAWSPAGGDKGLPAVYFGVALPGVERMLGVSLPLQGILDIGFRTIQFTTYIDAEKRRQYLMHLRDFGLHVLGLSFPPGNNDIILFGNPDQSSNTKLGWYAAYDNGKGEDKDKDKKTARAALTHDAPRRIRSSRPARLDRPDGETPS